MLNESLTGPEAGGTARRRRPKRTSRAVLIADRIADATITVGGLMVIFAVAGIMVFLVEVVVPLFTGGSVGTHTQYRLPPAEGAVLYTAVDEYNTVAVELGANGRLAAHHLRTGAMVANVDAGLGGADITAFAATLAGEEVMFGLADGSVRFGSVGIPIQVLAANGMPAGLRRLDERDATDGEAVYTPIAGGQVRKVALSFKSEEPQRVSDRPIRLLDYRLGGTVERPTRAFVTIDDAGAVRLSLAESRVNLLTRKASTRVSTSALPPLPDGLRPAFVLLTDKADQVYVAAEDGTILRYDTRDFDDPVLAERIDVLPGDLRLTAFRFLIGEQQIVVGASDGSADVYFRIQNHNAASTDGYSLVLGHPLERQPAPIVKVAPSKRSKMFATADADGNIWVRHATSEQTLLRLDSGEGAAGLVMSPRDNGLYAVDSRRQADFWSISVPHPETTLGTLFGKVWYEGYPAPSYTWQSSSGTDSFEEKFSLVPLIFGTIKATVYSLLFAVPIALLAAIYTSEFVQPRVRAVVKPMMEMMASLPSVVLGFIAALVLAPFVETWLAAVFAAFLTFPLCLLAAAYGWQFLPPTVAGRLSGVPKFLMMAAVVVLAGVLAVASAPWLEDLFFGGDVRAWANGDVGSGAPLVFFLAMPVAYILSALTYDRLAGRWLPALVPSGSGGAAKAKSLLRWLVVLGGAACASAALAAGMTWSGFEARGGIVDTYVQRNTLVVGFAMGFAVIPLIYTLAEDALNAVPEHLRAASLACGATPWQTAVRIILPAAVSGVFAAVMVGMGRAVGETMIVVMAAGNTPLMDWNVFNGLRALSANIAVELPEAVRDGTLYRVLFLAALTLFIMTFVINTAAEVVRQRFRKRAVQL